MTEEEKFSLKQFEAKVRQLIAQFGVLKQENSNLKEELQNKENEISILSSKIKQSKKDYENLKLAKMISISDGDIKATKQKITKLVRDVNSCINILSAESEEESTGVEESVEENEGNEELSTK